MIVSPPSVLAAFVAAVEVALGVVTLVAALRVASRTTGADERLPLLALLGGTLAATSLAGLPLLYLTLASYVPQWPGVMCVQGVTRVGEGSEGPARFLPGLLAALAVLRPAAIAAAGAWVAVRVADRSARTGPLARRVARLVAAAAVLAVAAGAVELAYVVIPKEERFLATGCCVAPSPIGDRAAESRATIPGVSAQTLTTLYFGGGAALAGAAAWLRSRAERGIAALPAVLAATAGIGHLGVSFAYANDVLCPAALALPHHRCAWCLAAAAPETIVGAALQLVGVLAFTWCAVTAIAARHAETEDRARRAMRSLSGWALFGYAGALAIAAVEHALA